ncbi:MAG: polyamine aminopropyltransferase [Nitrospinaceae bacterium]|jgi:spermidine synthase|nr:polyamine aminopropyltransferase [Nitrospinaceae bacterium]
MSTPATDNSENTQLRRLSFILKICVFTTGCAAMVTEYTLATLATYLLGNSILQWTIVISLMLFSMGLGSRYSRKFENHLLDRFVTIEFSLSFLCTFSAMFCFWIAAYTTNFGLVVYAVACMIGFMTGLEIPLITRINQSYESLRENISSVMEYDYYGGLIGGALFAFVLLPFLGLTYTPVLIGSLNLLVASLILWYFPDRLTRPRALNAQFATLFLVSVLAFAVAKPIILYSEQRKYKDKIVYQEQTRYQKIVLTQWKDDYWLFINGSTQFSTYDEERYHEPLVHPLMGLIKEHKDILLLGGGDGLAAREILKYPDVENLTLVDLDPAMTRLAQQDKIFLSINQGSLNDPRVRVVNQDAYQFINNSGDLYDAVIIDLPDPKSVSLSLLYSLGFYKMIEKHLKPFGAMVTQSTSPLYSPEAFLCIIKSMQAAGFSTLSYQNSVPSMGLWGWNIGVRQKAMPAQRLKQELTALEFSNIETRFLNQDAMISMTHFGKGLFEKANQIEPNTQFNHNILKYYRQGSWDLY